MAVSRNITVNQQPKNKAHFLKLKAFASEILNVLAKVGVKPALWGGLAYFGYTRAKDCSIEDIDLLVPSRSIPAIRVALAAAGLRHEFIGGWDSVVITKGALRVELDPYERYILQVSRSVKMDFSGLIIDVISLEALTRAYRLAAEKSEDKPEQHMRRYLTLKAFLAERKNR